MATMSFNKNAKTAAAQDETDSPTAGKVAEEPTDTTVATRQDSTLANTDSEAPEDFAGEWNREDVRLPRINLVHKTSDSDLIKKFGIGSFALNKEVKISDGETPVQVFALRASKDYVQKLPYESSEMPATFKTEAEVLSNGGSLNYQDVKSGNFFGPRAHVQLVVALPEGASEADEALFPYEFEGKSYAMALLTVASSAYTSVGKELATLRTNNKVMRKGLWFGHLDLTSETRKNAKNSWHIPVVKYTGENAPAFAEFLHGLLG